jgi:hypothetical protein
MAATAEKPFPKTTYYNAFPTAPRPGCSLAAVFWVIDNDHRVISRNERRNVVYPAKAAGLVADAPADTLGVQVNLKGETSRCSFVLTEKGRDYYERCVKPVLPAGYKSDSHLPKRRRATAELSTADIKAGK